MASRLLVDRSLDALDRIAPIQDTGVILHSLSTRHGFDCERNDKYPNYALTKNPACTVPLPSTKKEIEDRFVLWVQSSNKNLESDYCKPTLGKEQNWSTNQIVDAMDFVGITERFDENLIVMKEIF